MEKYALILIWLFPGISIGFSQSEDPVLRLKFLLLDDCFEELLQVTDTLEIADSLMDQVYYYRGRAYRLGRLRERINILKENLFFKNQIP